MKALFQCDDFSEALKAISPVFSDKIKVSLRAHRQESFNLLPENGGLLLVAESAHTQIRAFVPCSDVSGAGCVLNYREAVSRAKAFKGLVAFHYMENEKRAELSNKNKAYSMPATIVAPSGFEPAPEWQTTASRTPLQRITKRASGSIGDSFDYMAALCINPVNERIEFCAMNGRQMQYEFLFSSALAEVFKEERLIWDVKALAAWLAALPKKTDAIRLAGTKDFLFLQAGRTQYASRYYKSGYPDINGILNRRSEATAKIAFSHKDLIAALKELEPMTSTANRSGTFTFHETEARLTVKESGLSLPIKHCGKKFKIALPIKDLRKLVELAESPDGLLTLELTGNTGPAFIENGQQALAVIMPMKVFDDAETSEKAA